MELLNIKNLSASYDGHEAIKDVSLIINSGEYICLVGENGSGKSTLLKTVLGLHKKDSGEIVQNISDEKISYLQQNNMTDLSFPATAKEIIMTGVQKHGKLPFYKKSDWEAFDKVCEMLDIKQIINRQIGDLSGGQRQRVMLARSIIREPDLIILDEPCSGLDVNITKELYSLLEKLHNEKSMTIIMATHDLDEVTAKDIRVIHIAKGIKYDGKLENWEGLNH